MRPFFLLALLTLAGCSDSEPPGAPITDAERPDVPFVEVGDGGADAGDAATDGAVDAELDASLPFTCTGEPFDVRASAAGTNVGIALSASATEFVVVWTITTAGTTDVYARRIPASGALGATRQLTTNENTESSPAVLAKGSDWLVAWLDDTGTARDVFAYGFDPDDPDQATSVNVSNDAADDGVPRLFDAGSGSVILWYRPATSRANVTTLTADGQPATLSLVDTTTNLAMSPYVIDRAQGPAALLRTEPDTVGLLPLTATGISSGAGLTTLVAPGATTRLAFSRVDSAARVFVESTSSILMRALEANGELSGAASSAPTTGTGEHAPAAVGHDGAHLLAYRTTVSGIHTIRVAALRAGNGALISDTVIETLTSAPGDVAIARAASGDVLLVYTDASGSNVEIRGVRLACGGALP